MGHLLPVTSNSSLEFHSKNRIIHVKEANISIGNLGVNLSHAEKNVDQKIVPVITLSP